jgi:hypothetical protein
LRFKEVKGERALEPESYRRYDLRKRAIYAYLSLTHHVSSIIKFNQLTSIACSDIFKIILAVILPVRLPQV